MENMTRKLISLDSKDVITNTKGIHHLKDLTDVMQDTKYSDMLLSFVGAFVAPIILLQVMKAISPLDYSSYDLIGGILLTYTSYLLAKQSIRSVVSEYIDYFILFEIISFLIVQLLSVDSLVLRFASLVIFFPILSEIRNAILSDYINNMLIGSAITDYQQQRRSYVNMGNLLGLSLSIVCLYFNIMSNLETSLIIQFIGFLPFILSVKQWNILYKNVVLFDTQIVKTLGGKY